MNLLNFKQEEQGFLYPFILSEPLQEYTCYLIEGKRLMSEKRRYPYAVLRNGMGEYHGRQTDQENATKRGVRRQLLKFERYLEFVDTSYPMLYVTLTTGDKDLTFDELDKHVKRFLDKVAYHFPSYFAYIRRLELSEDSYKHAHLILFFDGNHTPRKFTRPWVQKHWTLGISTDVQRVYDYEGIKNYICKSGKHEFFKKGKVMYSYYDYGMKLITYSRNLPMTKNIKKIITTDKDFGEKLAQHMGLTHYHEVYHMSYIKGYRAKIVDRTFYY